MFRAAVEQAEGYTRPVVMSMRMWRGDVGAGVGSFVVVNDEGWIVTAAHVFEPGQKFADHADVVKDARDEIAAIESQVGLDARRRTRQIERIRANVPDDTMTEISYWWAMDGVALGDVGLAAEIDLAVARLDPIPIGITNYPIFKNPDVNFKPGTSLCRLGFPFA